MNAGMGITATGVIVRAQGSDFGMHSECAGDLMSKLVEAGFSPLDADIPAVIVGPLFADSSEWTCAHSECATIAKDGQ